LANLSFSGAIAATRKWCDIVGYLQPEHFPYWFCDHWTDDVVKMIGRISYADIRTDQSKAGRTQEMREPSWWATFFDACYLMRRRQARAILADEKKANGMVLRGFAGKPQLPSYLDLYGLRAAAIAVYPMYKGLAQLAGMTLVGKAQSLAEQIDELAACWKDYDFFFLHFKYTDSTGEDGAFEQKVKRIEELDRAMPRIEKLGPDVLIVTGDHSTPSKLKSHSWHPVPTVLAADTCRPDGLEKFSERECLRGGFGIFPAKHLMLLAMAHAQRLGKYGA
jgi:2,3-bisphosphoglycerate-independent phosphoglycerate mutase